MIEYWCARCEHTYGYKLPEGQWSLRFWLHEHKLTMPMHSIPKCPKPPTYDDVADLTLRKLGYMPGGQL